MVEVRKSSLFILFQAALSETDELVICSSISCYLFLYVRSFIVSEEKNTHHEKDVDRSQNINNNIKY